MNIRISSNAGELRMGDVQAMLSKVLWSPGITAEEISKGIRNSALVVGAYSPEGRQVGFLRVVSDKVRFAYIMDVVVDEAFQRQGIGQKMVQFAMGHAELKDVYQWLLKTKNAHGVYQKCGFEPLASPEEFMSVYRPRPDRRNFEG